MKDNHCKTGLDNRCRDQNGEIRHKRSDTLVRTLRKEYGEDFAEGTRSDATLGTVLERSGEDSLSQYLKKNG
ncbi:MAG TPA: hypothetical protein VKL40_09560 [Candidatus Angelobacter sp.]|nr:hypothetical protein [Candidatus Angelobacter sp.]